MKKEDKKIIDAAVAFVKAYRRRQIAGEGGRWEDDVRQQKDNILAAVDEKYKPKDNLIPPDLTQCQAQIQEGSFMTLGPRGFQRCSEVPTVIAKENKPGEDGQIGSMSLCDKCIEAFKKNMGEDHATFTPIERDDEDAVDEMPADIAAAVSLDESNGLLDDLVHDCASETGSRINNLGIADQIAFLRDDNGISWKYIREALSSLLQ